MPKDSASVAPESSRVWQILMSPHMAAAVAMFMWALSMVLVRGVRGDVPPVGLSFWRTLLALALILPFVVDRMRSDMRVLRAHWPILALLGFLLFVGGNASLFVGLQDTTAINASLINSFEPIAIVLVGAALFRDRMTGRQILGVVVSFIGVMALICHADPTQLTTLAINPGDLWVLAAIGSWAFYAVLMRRAPHGVSPLSLFTTLAFFGVVTLLPFYVWETVSGSPVIFSTTTVISVAVLAVFSTLLSVILWNRALHGLGSGRAALFVHLIPVYSILLAALFLGETLETYHVVGIVLIAIGIWLASRKQTAR